MSGRWAEKLGETICVNPGQQSSELDAVVFELNDTQVQSLSHTVYGQSDLLMV
jgi:Icc-related predicted phosphoesterase